MSVYDEKPWLSLYDQGQPATAEELIAPLPSHAQHFKITSTTTM